MIGDVLRRPVGAVRQHARAIAHQQVLVIALGVLLLLVEMLVETRLEEVDGRHVQHVEPHHRFLRGVAVVVDGPVRRQHEVARRHDGLLAVDLGVGALAVEDEADRRRRVAMRRRDLARQDELQAGVERLRDARLAAQQRILQHQHAARRLLGGDDGAGLGNVGPHVLVVPDRRRADRLRLFRNDVLQHHPERRHVELGDAVVIGLAGGLAVLAAVLPLPALVLAGPSVAISIAVSMQIAICV